MRVLTPKQLGRVVLGIVSLVFSVAYTQLAWQLSTGSLDRPGPGMWPRVVGISIVVVSLLTIVESALRPEDEAAIEWPSGPDLRRFLLFSALLVSYILLLPVIGFLVTSVLMTGLGIRVLAGSAWWKAAVISLTVVGVMYYLFINVLNVRFLSGWFI